jgi:hypothetical protein
VRAYCPGIIAARFSVADSAGIRVFKILKVTLLSAPLYNEKLIISYCQRTLVKDQQNYEVL